MAASEDGNGRVGGAERRTRHTRMVDFVSVQMQDAGAGVGTGSRVEFEEK